MKNKRGKEWGTGWDGKSRVPDKQYKENSNKKINWKNILNDSVKNNIFIYNPITWDYYNLYQLLVLFLFYVHSLVQLHRF
jgi:hypothetical protein